MKISFYGASQEVTGSNFLAETKNSKIMIDCGLFQGHSFYDDRNNSEFPYNLSEIDSVFVTHAHIDHIGRLPKLIRDGFKNKIYSTPVTKDFAEIMLIDSLGVLQKEAVKRGETASFYTEDDVRALMNIWETINYNQEFEIKDLKINFKDAGHILGSAMIEIKNDSKKIIFTGDLGNPPTPILPPTEEINDANFIITDSTYGGKIHEGREERKLKLERIIEDTVKKHGTLIVPSFSLERTQEILFELNDLIEKNRVPSISIFVDSPLAIKLMPIYKKYESYYNKETKYIINSGDDIFNFPNLHFSLSTEESKEINDIRPPKMIIAGSGMMNGGRIQHHAIRYLKDKNNTILFIGFQAANSLGRKIQEGVKKVKIFDEIITVKAKVETIDGYSAHPDSEGIMNFVSNSADVLEKVFCVHGELNNSLFLNQRIRDYLGIDAVSPKYGETFEI